MRDSDRQDAGPLGARPPGGPKKTTRWWTEADAWMMLSFRTIFQFSKLRVRSESSYGDFTIAVTAAACTASPRGPGLQPGVGLTATGACPQDPARLETMARGRRPTRQSAARRRTHRIHLTRQLNPTITQR